MALRNRSSASNIPSISKSMDSMQGELYETVVVHSRFTHQSYNFKSAFQNSSFLDARTISNIQEKEAILQQSLEILRIATQAVQESFSNLQNIVVDSNVSHPHTLSTAEMVQTTLSLAIYDGSIDFYLAGKAMDSFVTVVANDIAENSRGSLSYRSKLALEIWEPNFVSNVVIILEKGSDGTICRTIQAIHEAIGYFNFDSFVCYDNLWDVLFNILFRLKSPEEVVKERLSVQLIVKNLPQHIDDGVIRLINDYLYSYKQTSNILHFTCNLFKLFQTYQTVSGTEYRTNRSATRSAVNKILISYKSIPDVVHFACGLICGRWKSAFLEFHESEVCEAFASILVLFKNKNAGVIESVCRAIMHVMKYDIKKYCTPIMPYKEIFMVPGGVLDILKDMFRPTELHLIHFIIIKETITKIIGKTETKKWLNVSFK